MLKLMQRHVSNLPEISRQKSLSISGNTGASLMFEVTSYAILAL